MLKLSIGLVIAVIVGVGCRWFGLPLPGPPAIMGAAMAVAMATGYTATDYVLNRNRSVSTPPAIESPTTAASADLELGLVAKK
jgi:XapX domain-containing protein